VILELNQSNAEGAWAPLGAFPLLAGTAGFDPLCQLIGMNTRRKPA
jgi:hypothetical protein